MSGTRRFELIGDDDSTTHQPPPTAPAVPDAAAIAREAQARQLLFTALKALQQRALTAITNLFSLVLVGLVCLLTWRILEDPTENKLIAVGGFATFCLLLDVIRRRFK